MTCPLILSWHSPRIIYLQSNIMLDLQKTGPETISKTLMTLNCTVYSHTRRPQYLISSYLQLMIPERLALFRPCIDLHQGLVKQIIGGTLSDENPDDLKTNFVAMYFLYPFVCFNLTVLLTVEVRDTMHVYTNETI